MKWKAFRESGLNALVTCILRIKGTADRNTAAVSSLGNDLQNFARQTTETLKEVVDRLAELDKVDTAAAGEVTEMLEEVFGTSSGGPPAEAPDIAAEEEVAEMLEEVFGSSGSQSQSGIATEQEVTEMLNEVFSSSHNNE